MASSLFAFRLAKPVEFSDDVHIGVYDPITQTSTWDGGGPILALGCSVSRSGGRCYWYSGYCNTYGSNKVNNRACDP